MLSNLRPGQNPSLNRCVLRLQKLEGRNATVGTQLDELRAIVTEIVQRMRG